MMSVVYGLLKKIPSTSDEEVFEAASKLSGADDLATKSDIAQLRTKMTELEARLTWQMIVLGGIIIAAVGVIVKVL